MLASIRGEGGLGRSEFFAALSWVLCGSAIAGLGGHLDVLENDVPNTAAISSTKQLAGARLHTQRLADGVTLRQCVNPSGQVFAVGWEGPVLPDFHRLLGDHFQRYSDALRQQSLQVHIQNSDLVLEAGNTWHIFTNQSGWHFACLSLWAHAVAGEEVVVAGPRW
jgi:hypothetical protein